MSVNQRVGAAGSGKATHNAAGETEKSGLKKIVAASMAPIIAAALLQEYNTWVPVAIYILIACAITSVAVITLKETRGASLRKVDAVDARMHGLESVNLVN